MKVILAILNLKPILIDLIPKKNKAKNPMKPLFRKTVLDIRWYVWGMKSRNLKTVCQVLQDYNTA
jgi:hypothetical protein